MSDLTWRRVGKKSGPANVLNGRFRLEQVPTKRWIVRDLETGRFIPGPGTTAPYAARTMGAAKTYAEQYALKGGAR